MTKANFISFEDWVEWVFNRTGGGWVWNDENLSAKWFANKKLQAEYFIRLHDSPVGVLSKYSNGQVGTGLWNLYSGAVDIGPFGCSKVGADLGQRMIRSLVPLLRQLLPKRVPNDTGFENDMITQAVYMFWDIAPIWPFKPTDADKAELDVCLGEMCQALHITHPAAQRHALHGLGHFSLQASERTTSIIDEWLSSNPRISPSIREYALAARVGAIQ